MKTLLTLTAVFLLVIAPLAMGLEIGAAENGSIQTALESLDGTACLIQGTSTLPNFMLPVEAQWGLPSCSSIDGTSCSAPGGPLARCYNYQYEEPGVCQCQANLTFSCF